jgi:hypothetical protein
VSSLSAGSGGSSIHDKPKVSESLAAGEQLTVPNEKNWRVTIKVSRPCEALINGSVVTSAEHSVAAEWVTNLTSGDVVKAVDSDGLHMGGYEI